MPSFNGNLSEFLARNIRYPERARKQNQEGRAVVEFVVRESGLVSDLRIKKSSGFELLDEEALRVAGLMEYKAYWKPGINNGQPVSVFYALPFKFKMD